MVSSRIKLHDDLLKATFQRFDIDNSGFITADNLRQVLGEAFEGENIDHLMKEAHAQDGKISMDDFVAFLKHPDAQDHHQDAAARIIDMQAQHPDHKDERVRKIHSKAADSKPAAGKGLAGSASEKSGSGD